MTALLVVMFAAYCQNIAFSVVSRARNRDSHLYHLIAAVASNGVWFLTFKLLVTSNMDWRLFVPYTIGTVAGSMTGSKVSMHIEKLIGAKT